MYKLLLLSFLVSSSFYAQQNRTIFFGKIHDDLGVLENVHIINLNTNQATSSNFNGEFKIFAKVTDSLKITSIGYKMKVLKLKISDFGINEKQINLKKEVIELDEVEIKKNNLTGNIESDVNQVPKDRIAAMAQSLVNSIKKLDYEAIMQMPLGEDELHLRKVAAPGIPDSFGAGAGATLPDYHGIRKRATRKLIKFKEGFPLKLLSEFGTHFFFT